MNGIDADLSPCDWGQSNFKKNESKYADWYRDAPLTEKKNSRANDGNDLDVWIGLCFPPVKPGWHISVKDTVHVEIIVTHSPFRWEKIKSHFHKLLLV